MEVRHAVTRRVAPRGRSPPCLAPWAVGPENEDEPERRPPSTRGFAPLPGETRRVLLPAREAQGPSAGAGSPRRPRVVTAILWLCGTEGPGPAEPASGQDAALVSPGEKPLVRTLTPGPRPRPLRLPRRLPGAASPSEGGAGGSELL